MRSFAIFFIAMVPAALAASASAPPVTMAWQTDVIKAAGDSSSMDMSMMKSGISLGGKMTMSGSMATKSAGEAMSTGKAMSGMSMAAGKTMSGMTMSMTGKATGTGSPAMATTNAASPAVAGVGIAGAAMVVGGLLMGSL